MGLLSYFFKSKPKPTYDTSIGEFTLIYSSKFKNTWSNNSDDILLSVQGSTVEPDAAQIRFLANWQAELNRLDERITARFIREFKEADLAIDFTHWSNKFKIVAVYVMLLVEQDSYWNITFEAINEPFTHFTLFIEGEKLTDFSIDT